MATRGKDNATSLAEQARTAESLARQHHRTGLQMAGSLGFNELSMARHLTVVARSFMEGARRHA